MKENRDNKIGLLYLKESYFRKMCNKIQKYLIRGGKSIGKDSIRKDWNRKDIIGKD